jgi:hypothetical protein
MVSVGRSETSEAPFPTNQLKSAKANVSLYFSMKCAVLADDPMSGSWHNSTSVLKSVCLSASEKAWLCRPMLTSMRTMRGLVSK